MKLFLRKEIQSITILLYVGFISCMEYIELLGVFSVYFSSDKFAM